MLCAKQIFLCNNVNFLIFLDRKLFDGEAVGGDGPEYLSQRRIVQLEESFCRNVEGQRRAGDGSRKFKIRSGFDVIKLFCS